jgi:membrane protein DedA with SNARE-associated domain
VRIRRLLVPLVVLLLLTATQVLSYFQIIASPSTFLEQVTQLLGSGSLFLIAVFSFFEGLVILNVYFPGSVVILFSMAATHGDPTRALVTLATIVGGSAAAHQLNFGFGRVVTGARPDLVPQSKTRLDLSGALLSYWHPQLGSLYSTRAGAEGQSYAQFLVRFGVGFGFWNLFWGVLMYNLGQVPVSGSEFLGLFYVYLLWWFFDEYRQWRKRSLTSVD